MEMYRISKKPLYKFELLLQTQMMINVRIEDYDLTFLVQPMVHKCRLTNWWKNLNIYFYYCTTFNACISSFAFVIKATNCKEILWTPCRTHMLFICYFNWNYQLASSFNFSNTLNTDYKSLTYFTENRRIKS